MDAGVADVGINAAADDPVEKIKQATGGLGVDVCIETAGTPESFNMALGATRTRGIVSTVSLFAQAFTVPMNLIIYKGLTIKMGMQSCEGIDEMMELIQAGKIDTKYLLTHKAPLNDIMKGYEVFGNHQDGCMKWVVTPYER
jgi:alcohol dehydrogenase